jgi:hydrogenase maturation protein HypF
VQHHHAHAAACLVEHQQSGPGLALALDGAGLGSDGTIWGGELLRVDLRSCERIAHLEAVRLPGGDAAVREPWRMAAVWLDRAFPEGPPALPWHRRRDADRLRAVREIAARGLHSPWTSSCGRLFDAVASLLDLCDHASHEGEAALRLEAAAAAASANEPENDPVQAAEPARAIPVADLVRRLVRARAAGHDVATLARRFHEQLAARLCAAVEAAAAQTGLRSVVLTGGCLQNRLFEAALRRRLAVARLEPLVHRRVPPNDGGLAVGQAAVAAARIASGAVA